MNKKVLFIVILVLTAIIFALVIIANRSTRYSNLQISSSDLNELLSTKNMDSNIKLEKIELDEYDLLIDEKNSIVYYSVVESSSKYNPLVSFKTNSKDLKLKIFGALSDDILEMDNVIKLVIYNDTSYRIYTLVATKYPILNVNILKEKTKQIRIPVEIELFDNNKNIPQKLQKSLGELDIVSKDEEYFLRLQKESLGRNIRENHISLFGMEKQDEYHLLREKSETGEKKYLRLYINNEYNGIYSLEFKMEGR